MSVDLVILVDNLAHDRALQAEHGLAVLLRGPDGELLFDAAASSQALLGNAKALGVDLAGLRGFVLSHGHSDHTGGLAAAAQCRAGLKIFAHPGAFSRRWADQPGKPLKDVSCPHSRQRLTQAGASLVPVRGPEMLASWLVLSGPIGGPADGRQPFVIRKGDEMVVDNFEDELCCLIRGREGWTVLTGCCHRGLKNTLRAARFLTRREPIANLVGGLHLRDAGEEELAESVEVLRSFGPPRIYPCHCTGQRAIAYLQEQLPGCVHAVAAGSKLTV